MTERCNFAQELLFSGRMGKLYCGYPNCDAIFEIINGSLQLKEGVCRRGVVANKIDEIKKTLKCPIDRLEKDDLEIQLRDLENELNDDFVDLPNFENEGNG